VGRAEKGFLQEVLVLLVYVSGFCLYLLPLPSLLKSPSFEDRKHLGMAQHRKGGNFKSKSRYKSVYFLIQGFFCCGVGFFFSAFSFLF